MEEERKKRGISFVLWGIVFLGAFFICTQIQYSDGDDAFFYEYSHSMGFLEYLIWRYESWTGRLTVEALLYLNFRSGIWFWRVVNGLVLMLLPFSILVLLERVDCGQRIGKGEHGSTLLQQGKIREHRFLEPVFCILAILGYFLMNVRTLGYSGFWITGSVNYIWCFLCMIWALVPVADWVFETGLFHKKQLLYSIPCAGIAAMSVEQTGAVLIAFEVIAVGCVFWKKHRTDGWILVQTGISVVMFLAMFLAPGNDLRVAKAIETCMPQYAMLTFGEHFFITFQWLISSFARENVLFLAGIWIVGSILLKDQKAYFYKIAAFIFTVSAVLSMCGVSLFADLGISLKDMTGIVTEVPKVSDLTAQNWFAMIWWTVALVFTFFFIWKVTGGSATMLLTYLGGIAGEAVLYFSPTMYSSGERVFFITDDMLLFILLLMCCEIKEKKRLYLVAGILMVLGISNFVLQIPEVLRML